MRKRTNVIAQRRHKIALSATFHIILLNMLTIKMAELKAIFCEAT